MTVNKDDIRGIMPPAVTPFGSDDSVDEEAYRRDLRFMLEVGVQGLVCGGSTGEGATLSLDEARRLYSITATEAAGKVPAIAGVIANSTVDAVAKAQAAKEAGMDAVMVTPTYYPANLWDDEGLVEFYRDVWEKGGLPIIIYNVLEHAPVRPKVLPRLADIPGLIGVKESSGGNLQTLTEIIDLVGDRLAVTWAYDPIMMPGYAVGAVGAISAINTILPELCLLQWQAMERGDLEEARRTHFRLHKVTQHIYTPNWSSRIKEAINLQGRTAGKARSPQRPVTTEESEALAQGLREAGVLVRA